MVGRKILELFKMYNVVEKDAVSVTKTDLFFHKSVISFMMYKFSETKLLSHKSLFEYFEFKSLMGKIMAMCHYK